MIINYAVYEPITGKLKLWGGVASNPVDVPKDTSTSKVYYGLCGPNNYIKEGVAVEYPPKPDPSYEFNYYTHQWEDKRILKDYMDLKWEEIKKDRKTAEEGGFTWDGSSFDSTPLSQSRILGSQQVSAITPGYSVNWTLADNSTRVLYAQDLLLLSQALGDHIQKQVAHGQEIRIRIYAATTKDQVLSIMW